MNEQMKRHSIFSGKNERKKERRKERSPLAPATPPSAGAGSFCSWGLKLDKGKS